MANNFDLGAQGDFDSMTEELGAEILIYPRKYDTTHEGYEDENTKSKPASKEIAFLQELDTKHEVVVSGQFNVGDVRVTLQANTIANEECQILANGNTYKILNLTYVKGMNNGAVLYVKAFGKKLPKR